MTLRNQLAGALLPAALLLAFPASAQEPGTGLRVGTARIDITPPADPAAANANEFEHEKLYLRAIVVDDGRTRAALIGADLGGINEPVWREASDRVSRLIGAPSENVVLSSTHTHSDRPPTASGTSTHPRYGTDFVAARAEEAVRQAMGAMRPARVGFGKGRADLNVNRDAVSETTHRWTQAADPDGPSDKTVAVLSFTTPEGEPIAAYANYAMHPVNGYLSGLTSADFAGAASRWVEDAFGDRMVAIVTQGASGDQNPHWLRAGTNALASRSGVPVTGWELVREEVEAPLRDGRTEGRPPEARVVRQLGTYMQALGTILGEETIRVMTQTRDRTANAPIWSARETLTCPGRTRLDTAREGSPGRYEDGPDVALRLGALGFGDIALGSVNAEIYTAIGERTKAASPLSKTMLVTIANGRAESGYVPDDKSFGHETFQVLASKLKPGCAERGIADGIAGLIGGHLND